MDPTFQPLRFRNLTVKNRLFRSNKCLLHVVEDPFGCYELSRYDGDYEHMMHAIMSVFEPSYIDPPSHPSVLLA